MMGTTTMTDEEKAIDGFAGLALLAVGFVLGFPIVWLRAWTASLVWAWLVVPFSSLGPVPVPVFVGVFFAWNVLRYAGESHAEKAARKGKTAIESTLHLIGNQVTAALGCGLTLAFAWLWHLWFTR